MISNKFPSLTRSATLLVSMLVLVAVYDIVTRVILLVSAEPHEVAVFDGLVGKKATPSQSSMEGVMSWFDGDFADSAESESDLPDADVNPEGEVKNLLSDGAVYRLAGVFGLEGDFTFAVLQRIQVTDRTRQTELLEVRIGDAVGLYSVQSVNLNSVTLVDRDQREVELVIFEMKSDEATQQ